MDSIIINRADICLLIALIEKEIKLKTQICVMYSKRSKTFKCCHADINALDIVRKKLVPLSEILLP